MHGHHGRDIYYFHNQLAFADGPDGFEIRQGFVAWQGAAKLILCQLYLLQVVDCQRSFFGVFLKTYLFQHTVSVRLIHLCSFR